MNEREPKGPIQRIASGLLGFFNLKDQGNPGVIRDALQGTLELKDWYFETSSEIPAVISSIAVSPATSGFFPFNTNPLTVPQNEWWFVENFSLYAALPLGTDSFAGQPAMRMPNTSQDFVLTPEMPATRTGPNQAWSNAAFGFWAPPGASLGVYIGQCASATTVAVNGGIRFTRLPI